MEHLRVQKVNKIQIVAIRFVLLSSKCSKTAPNRAGGAYNAVQTGSNVREMRTMLLLLFVISLLSLF